MGNQFQGMPVPENVYRRRRLMLFIAVIIIFIVIISVVLLLTRESEPQSVNEEEVAEFKINKVLFASDVDENFVYIARDDDTFSKGEDIWVYAEVSGYPSYEVEGGFNVIISMDIRTLDAKNEVVQLFTGNLVNIVDVVQNKDTLFFARSLGTTEMSPGLYTMEFTFIDLIGFLPLRTTKQFKVVE